MNETRQSIEDYVHYRNKMDMERLYNRNNDNYNYNNNCNHPSNQFQIDSIYNRIPYYSYGNNYKYDNTPSYYDNIPWMFDLTAIFPYYNNVSQEFTPVKPKIDLFKPLTKADDIQFKKFTGLNPNQLSFQNLVDYRMINPFTRQPFPQFENKIKPVYNEFSLMPSHYNLTPDMKRQLTFTLAEREGFRGHNSF